MAIKIQGDTVIYDNKVFKLGTGTTAERPAVPEQAMIWFNTDLGSFEGFDGTSWGAIGGGATGGSGDAVFIENDQTVTSNYTIPATKNALTTGPIQVNDGVIVTISPGARWVVI